MSKPGRNSITHIQIHSTEISQKKLEKIGHGTVKNLRLQIMITFTQQNSYNLQFERPNIQTWQNFYHLHTKTHHRTIKENDKEKLDRAEDGYRLVNDIRSSADERASQKMNNPFRGPAGVQRGVHQTLTDALIRHCYLRRRPWHLLRGRHIRRHRRRPPSTGPNNIPSRITRSSSLSP